MGWNLHNVGCARLLRTASIIVLLCFPPAALAAPSEDSAGRIRTFLEGLDAGDAPLVSGRTLQQPRILSNVYRSRDHAPIWLTNGPLSNQVQDMLAAISESVGHGFLAERYHRSTIEQLMGARDESAALALELLLTDAFLAQALHRGRGAVSPPDLDAEWQLPQAEVDAGALLLDTARRKRAVSQTLGALWPANGEYERLVQRRAEIAATGDVMTVQVASGPLLKPGQSNERIRILKQRLMGPADHTSLYDDDLRREVVAFQRAAGLEPDGMVGDNTLEVLNATQVSWIDRIDANLERWRWLPRDTPDTYLRVNIAAFSLRAVDAGRTTLSMNVIVGRPYRRTPVFSESMKYMVLNPYWNVPSSIATKDKLQLLRADAAAQAVKGYETKPHGSDVFVPVDAIDWRQVTQRNFNYLLRQRPGPENALGRIKFMLPNPFAVYLHDTPSRELFARQERSFSSGCVRLERPVELAEWLLARERHPVAGKVEALLATKETQTLHLKKPIPTYIVYFTAFVADADVVFRRDIYARDAVLVEALRTRVSSEPLATASPAT